MTIKELAAKHIEDAIRHGYFTLVNEDGEEIQRVVGTPTILSLCKLELKDTETTKEIASDNNTPSEMFNNPALMDPLGQLELSKLSMYEAKLVESPIDSCICSKFANPDGSYTINSNCSEHGYRGSNA